MTDELARNGVTPIVMQEALWLKRLGHSTTTLVIRNRGNPMNETVEEGFRSDIFYLSDTLPGFLRFSPKFPIFQNLSLSHFSSPFLVSPKSIPRLDALVSHGTYTCLTGKSLAARTGSLYLPFIHDPISYILNKSYSASILSPMLPALRRLGIAADKYILKGASAVLTNSSFHFEFLRTIQRKQVYPLHPGCMPAEHIPDARGSYLLAGKARWTFGANAELMVRITSKLSNKTTLVVTGGWDPGYYKKIIRLVHALSLQDQVRIVGLGSIGELFDLYRGARAIVACSEEAFGMMCIEGACFGCPFIIPLGSGVTDLFVHGIHGFFPPKDDLEAYVKYVDMLASNERLSWSLGHNAWQAAKGLTWENHAKRLIRIIEESDSSS